MNYQLVDMPADSEFSRTAARWGFDQWESLSSNESLEWYLNLHADAARDPDALPLCIAAITDEQVLAGTASVTIDDDLPGSIEPGPWIAAVFVNPEFRGEGVGSMLVNEAVRRARSLGAGDLYLYTEAKAEWYETMGWQRVREDYSLNHPVTVMVHRG